MGDTSGMAKHQGHDALFWVSVGLLAFFNLAGLVALTHSIGTYPMGWASYFDAAHWVRDNTPQDAIVSCRKEFLFHLESERTTKPYRWTADPDSVLRGLHEDGVGYVVVEVLGYPTSWKYLVPCIKAHPEAFKLVHMVPRKLPAWVYKVLP